MPQAALGVNILEVDGADMRFIFLVTKGTVIVLLQNLATTGRLSRLLRFARSLSFYSLRL